MDLGRSYLELALRFAKLAPGLVEDYSGPAELARGIERESPVQASALVERARELEHQIQDLEPEPDRRAWLSAQVAGISTALERMDGRRFSYRELTERCHGAKASLVPESHFESAHRQLDQVLPGRGDVRERCQRWAATQLVPRTLLPAGIEALKRELRRRSHEMFGLPAGEDATFELVSGERYAGNAAYQGGLRTRIRINQDLPIGSFKLLELISHEAYPGHHSEFACKGADLIADRGRIELAVFVYTTPQLLMSEGVACHALEVLLGDEADEVGARCLAPLGIPYDAEIAATVREVEQVLDGVRPNLALMLDEDRFSPEQTRAYARRWMLQDDHYVDCAVSGLEARIWRPCESCYQEGLELCRRFTAGDPARFRRLLHEQLTPARLVDGTEPAIL